MTGDTRVVFVIVSVSAEAPQTPLTTDHITLTVSAPLFNVTDGLVLVVLDNVPLLYAGTKDHDPVPDDGTEADKVVVLTLHNAGVVAVATALEGALSTVITWLAEPLPQLVTAVYVTVYVPEAVTTNGFVVPNEVDPFVQLYVPPEYPVEEAVRLTEPPIQNSTGPEAVITGAGGVGFTVTVIVLAEPEQPFNVYTTKY